MGDITAVSLPLTSLDGRLNPAAMGFRPFPMIQAQLAGRWGRRKRWTYFSFCNGRELLAFALVDLDYAGHVFVTLYDYEQKTFVQKEKTIPFAFGIRLPEHPTSAFHYKSRDFLLAMQAGDKGLGLEIGCRSLGGHDLKAQFQIDLNKSQESLNVVIPWSPSLYHYTAKMCALPVSGQLEWGAKKALFAREKSLACQDFARGIWPWKSRWNWCSAFGHANNERVGLNLGAGWTDGTGAWENAFYHGDKVFHMPMDMKFQAADNSFQRWTIQSQDPSVLEMEFEANYVRRAKNRVLFLRSDLVQCFGHIKGRIREGDAYHTLAPIPAIIEDHGAVW